MLHDNIITMYIDLYKGDVTVKVTEIQNTRTEEDSVQAVVLLHVVK